MRQNLQPIKPTGFPETVQQKMMGNPDVFGCSTTNPILAAQVTSSSII